MDSKQNWEIAKNVGVDKENKDYICEHDAEHGYYKESDGGKPIEAQPKILPNTPQPFKSVK